FQNIPLLNPVSSVLLLKNRRNIGCQPLLCRFALSAVVAGMPIPGVSSPAYGLHLNVSRHEKPWHSSVLSVPTWTRQSLRQCSRFRVIAPSACCEGSKSSPKQENNYENRASKTDR